MFVVVLGCGCGELPFGRVGGGGGGAARASMRAEAEWTSQPRLPRAVTARSHGARLSQRVRRSLVSERGGGCPRPLLLSYRFKVFASCDAFVPALSPTHPALVPANAVVSPASRSPPHATQSRRAQLARAVDVRLAHSVRAIAGQCRLGNRGRRGSEAGGRGGDGGRTARCSAGLRAGPSWLEAAVRRRDEAGRPAEPGNPASRRPLALP